MPSNSTTILPLQTESERLTERLAGRLGLLTAIRAEALDRFQRAGFPTIKDEEWRFTNLRQVAATPYTLAEPADDRVTATDVARLSLAGVGGPLLVFVDAAFRPDLSSVRDLPAGVHVLSLLDAAAAAPDVVAADLARHAGIEGDPLTALNTAFIEDGAYIRIDRGVTSPKPIHILYISAGADRPRMTHPRNLIVVEAGSSATIVEQYASMGAGEYLSNTVTEVVARENATVRHLLVEEDSPAAAAISTLHVTQETGADVQSHTLLLGGAIVRNNIHVELKGAGGRCLINGLFMPRGEQHMDNHMRVVHATPHCDSRQFYHGILDDQSRGVFTGRIVVRPGAQKTDAKQTSRNLLLSDAARINARPQLEIYADDVKCTHGATTGKLDDAALFYLRTRGIPAGDARALLVYAFAAEALERIGDDDLRNAFHRRVIQRLPEAGGLAALDEPIDIDAAAVAT